MRGLFSRHKWLHEKEFFSFFFFSFFAAVGVLGSERGKKNAPVTSPGLVTYFLFLKSKWSRLWKMAA